MGQIQADELVAEELLNLVRARHALEVTYFANDQLQLRRLRLKDDSGLVGRALQDIKIPDGVLVAAISRGGELVVPSGDDELRGAAEELLAAYDGKEEELLKNLTKMKSKQEAKAKKEEADRQARRDAKKREAEEKAAASREAARKHEELKEANREKIEELKQDYYLRKAKRERWEAFRAENKSRGNTNDYYRGWDLFEDDPDEELFSGDNPAAVQDQAAFDAMAKDVEERTARRKADKAAGAKEKEAGNAAFKEGQHSNPNPHPNPNPRGSTLTLTLTLGAVP